MDNIKNIWENQKKFGYKFQVCEGELTASRRKTSREGEIVYILEFIPNSGNEELIFGVYKPSGELVFDEKDFPIAAFRDYFLSSNLPREMKKSIRFGLKLLNFERQKLASKIGAY